jgi:hypothetical protein
MIQPLSRTAETHRIMLSVHAKTGSHISTFIEWRNLPEFPFYLMGALSSLKLWPSELWHHVVQEVVLMINALKVEGSRFLQNVGTHLSDYMVS